MPSTLGAGLSELSGPFQSTTEPSAYVWRTPNVYVFDASALALKRKTASWSVGTLPPVHVTLWTTASSPDPVERALCFHPAGGGSRRPPSPSAPRG
jgi:hypothetical protein